MKKKVVSKILAGLLAAGMVISVAACGNTDDGSSSSGNSSSGTGSSTPASTSGGSDESSQTPAEPLIDESFTNITVALPLTSSAITEHDTSNELYQYVVNFINEYTGMNVTWDFLQEATYYDALAANIIAGNVGDVQVVGNPATDATFTQAAEEGLFWDLAPYLDEFDNLATIPEAVRANISYNGKIYALPRSRTLGRNGVGYRKDWLEALNMKEPETVDDWYEMLSAFTHQDPDGNGLADTVGLLIENYNGYFDMIEIWYGVPNQWGIDANGDLIPKQLTDEWKTALKEFKKWYDEGLIPANFDEIEAGRYRQHISGGNEGTFYGAGVDVLDNLRKIEVDFENAQENYTVDMGFTFQLAGGMKNTDGKLHVLPTDGYSGGIAISTKNVKTEAQLRRVLQFLNDLNDGDIELLIDSGIEGKTWELDEDGYIRYYTTEELEALGVGTSYRDGFNQVIAYYNAPENAKPYTTAPYEAGSVQELENQLYESNLDYVVINYGAGYVSETYTDFASSYDDASLATARTRFIKGEIDEVGLDAAIEAWLNAGMQKVIEEKNASYHAAGN